MGQTEVVPDVPQELERRFAAWIDRRIRSNMELDFREVTLEAVMNEFGCPNKKTLQKLLQRFDGLGVLEKGTAKNSTRKLAGRGYLKLKNLLPAPASPTQKQA